MRDGHGTVRRQAFYLIVASLRNVTEDLIEKCYRNRLKVYVRQLDFATLVI